MTCPRIFEVEAARDGRITDRGSVERHLQTCAACRARGAELDALATSLRNRPVADDDELAAQRGRNRLVTAFDASLTAPPRRHGGRIALVTAALGAIAIGWGVAGRTPAPSPSLDPIHIDAASARWSRLDAGTTTVVKLDEGDARIALDHRGGPRRLIVIVPDGEIEDVGTTFLVRVRAGRTTEIVVDEGAVVFRRGLEPAVALHAGQRWLADEQITARSPAPPAPPAPAPSPPPVPPKRATGTGKPGAYALGAVMAKLDRGENVAAAATLREILARNPRAEDAAYLLVIALQRAGDAGGARAAARDYLQRFPDGFRRAALEPLAP